MALKNVSSYIKNLGKSVKYAAQDEFKHRMPAASEFVETNQEIFKETYGAIKNYRHTVLRVHRFAKKSKVYEAANVGLNSLFEDIKTGNFYNKEREDNENVAAMGGLDEDFDFSFDDWGKEDSSSGDVNVKTSSSAPKGGSKASIQAATRENADVVSNTIAKATEVSLENSRATTTLMMQHVSVGFSNLHTGIHSMAQMINDNFNGFNDQFNVYSNNSKTFYENMTKDTHEIKAMLGELLEMERNRYQTEQEEEKNKGKSTFSDITGANGMPDLKEYFERIKSNGKNAGGMLGSAMGMLDAFEGNALSALVSSPLKFIPEAVVKAAIPATVGYAAQELDKSLSTVFANFVGKFNEMASDSDAGFLGNTLGKLLGVKNSLITSLKPTKVDAKAVPFDNVVREAIITEIPTYLRKILSYISGEEEMIFNRDKGTFTTGRELQKEFDSIQANQISSSFSDFNEEMDKLLKYIQFETGEQKKSFEDFTKRMQQSQYTKGYVGNVANTNFEKAAEKFNLSSSDELNYAIYQSLFKNIDKSVLMELSGNILSGRDSQNNRMKDYQKQSVYSALFNNSNPEQFVQYDKHGNNLSRDIKGLDKNGKYAGGPLGFDSFGHDIFYYLQNMYSELSYIRQEGIPTIVKNSITVNPDGTISRGGGGDVPPTDNNRKGNKSKRRKRKRKNNSRQYNDWSEIPTEETSDAGNQQNIPWDTRREFTNNFNITRDQSRISPTKRDDKREREKKDKYTEKARKNYESGKDYIYLHGLEDGTHEDIGKAVHARIDHALDFRVKTRSDRNSKFEEFKDERYSGLSGAIVKQLEQIADPKRRNANNEDFNYDAEDNKNANDKEKLEKKDLLTAASEIVKKPSKWVEDVLNATNARIYNLFFGKTDIIDEKTGKPIKGLGERIAYEFRKTWDKIGETFQEKFLDPLREKLGLDEDESFIHGILRKMGLEDAVYGENGIWTQTKEQLRGAGQWVMDQLEGTYKDVKKLVNGEEQKPVETTEVTSTRKTELEKNMHEVTEQYTESNNAIISAMEEFAKTNKEEFEKMIDKNFGDQEATDNYNSIVSQIMENAKNKKYEKYGINPKATIEQIIEDLNSVMLDDEDQEEINEMLNKFEEAKVAFKDNEKKRQYLKDIALNRERSESYTEEEQNHLSMLEKKYRDNGSLNEEQKAEYERLTQLRADDSKYKAAIQLLSSKDSVDQLQGFSEDFGKYKKKERYNTEYEKAKQENPDKTEDELKAIAEANSKIPDVQENLDRINKIDDQIKNLEEIMKNKKLSPQMTSNYLEAIDKKGRDIQEILNSSLETALKYREDKRDAFDQKKQELKEEEERLEAEQKISERLKLLRNYGGRNFAEIIVAQENIRSQAEEYGVEVSDDDFEDADSTKALIKKIQAKIAKKRSIATYNNNEEDRQKLNEQSKNLASMHDLYSNAQKNINNGNYVEGDQENGFEDISGYLGSLGLWDTLHLNDTDEKDNSETRTNVSNFISEHLKGRGIKDMLGLELVGNSEDSGKLNIADFFKHSEDNEKLALDKHHLTADFMKNATSAFKNLMPKLGDGEDSEEAAVEEHARGGVTGDTVYAALSKGEKVEGVKVPATDVYKIPVGLNVDPNGKGDPKGEASAKRNFIDAMFSKIKGYAEGGAVGLDDETSLDEVMEQAEHDQNTADQDVNQTKKFKSKVNPDDTLVGQTIDTAKQGIDAVFQSLFDPGDDKKLQDAADDVFKNIREYAPSGLAGGIIGGGIGLLVGGPLLAASAGAAIGIAKNSDKVKNWLFGDIGADGEREGGIISKNTQQTIKKYVPDLSKYGVSGAVLGLLTPFGPVGGLMIGSAVAWAKNNDEVKNALFGDEDGLLNKDRRAAIKKAFPNVAAATIGMLVAGPFGGLLPNAVLGTGLGLLSTTDGFKDAIFGEKDANGERHGGLLGTLKEHVIDPLKEFAVDFKDRVADFVIENMINPVKDAIKPIAKQALIASKSIFGVAGKAIGWVYDKSIGTPLGTFVKEQIIDRAKRWIGGIFKVLTAPAKAVISAPFKMVGAIGNHYRNVQINKGNADHMTAEERMAYRAEHPDRDTSTFFLGRNKDKYEKADTMLADMDVTELTRMRDALENMQIDQKSVRKREHGFKREIFNTVDEFFSDRQHDGMPILTKANRKRLVKLIEAGKSGDAIKLLTKLRGKDGKKLDKTEVEQLVGKFADQARQMRTLKLNKRNWKSTEKEARESLKDMGFEDVKGDYKKRLQSYVNVELKDRKSRGMDQINPAEGLSGDMFKDVIHEENTRIIEVFEGLGEKFDKVGEALTKGTEYVSVGNKKNDQKANDTINKQQKKIEKATDRVKGRYNKVAQGVIELLKAHGLTDGEIKSLDEDALSDGELLDFVRQLINDGKLDNNLDMILYLFGDKKLRHDKRKLTKVVDLIKADKNINFKDADMLSNYSDKNFSQILGAIKNMNLYSNDLESQISQNFKNGTGKDASEDKKLYKKYSEIFTAGSRYDAEKLKIYGGAGFAGFADPNYDSGPKDFNTPGTMRKAAGLAGGLISTPFKMVGSIGKKRVLDKGSILNKKSNADFFNLLIKAGLMTDKDMANTNNYRLQEKLSEKDKWKKAAKDILAGKAKPEDFIKGYAEGGEIKEFGDTLYTEADQDKDINEFKNSLLDQISVYAEGGEIKDENENKEEKKNFVQRMADKAAEIRKAEKEKAARKAEEDEDKEEEKKEDKKEEEKNREAETKNTVVFDNMGRAKNMLITKYGDPQKPAKVVEGNDSVTNETIAAQEKERNENVGILSSITGAIGGIGLWLKNSILPDNDVDKYANLKSWLGKAFLGATALGALPLIRDAIVDKLIPAVQNAWKDNAEPWLESNVKPIWDDKIKPYFGSVFEGIIDTIGTGFATVLDIPRFLSDFATGTLLPWFTGDDSYTGSFPSFPRLITDYLIPYYVGGFSFLVSDVVPAFIKAFSKILPSLIKAGIQGVGSILSIDLDASDGRRISSFEEKEEPQNNNSNSTDTGVTFSYGEYTKHYESILPNSSKNGDATNVDSSSSNGSSYKTTKVQVFGIKDSENSDSNKKNDDSSTNPQSFDYTDSEDESTEEASSSSSSSGGTIIQFLTSGSSSNDSSDEEDSSNEEYYDEEEEETPTEEDDSSTSNSPPPLVFGGYKKDDDSSTNPQSVDYSSKASNDSSNEEYYDEEYYDDSSTNPQSFDYSISDKYDDILTYNDDGANPQTFDYTSGDGFHDYYADYLTYNDFDPSNTNYSIEALDDKTSVVTLEDGSKLYVQDGSLRASNQLVEENEQFKQDSHTTVGDVAKYSLARNIATKGQYAKGATKVIKGTGKFISNTKMLPFKRFRAVTGGMITGSGSILEYSGKLPDKASSVVRKAKDAYGRISEKQATNAVAENVDNVEREVVSHADDAVKGTANNVDNIVKQATQEEYEAAQRAVRNIIEEDEIATRIMKNGSAEDIKAATESLKANQVKMDELFNNSKTNQATFDALDRWGKVDLNDLGKVDDDLYQEISAKHNAAKSHLERLNIPSTQTTATNAVKETEKIGEAAANNVGNIEKTVASNSNKAVNKVEQAYTQKFGNAASEAEANKLLNLYGQYDDAVKESNKLADTITNKQRELETLKSKLNTLNELDNKTPYKYKQINDYTKRINDAEAKIESLKADQVKMNETADNIGKEIVGETDDLAEGATGAGNKGAASVAGATENAGEDLGKGANKGAAGATDELAEGATGAGNKGAASVAGAADELAEGATGAGRDASKATNAVVTNIDDATEAIAENAGRETGEIGETVAKNGVLKKFTKFITESIPALFKKVGDTFLKTGAGQVLHKAGQKLANTLVGKITKLAAKTIAKAATKLASVIASGGTLGVLFAINDFIYYYKNATAVLGVQDPTFTEKLFCACYGVLKNIYLLSALIPDDVILDLVVEYILPHLGEGAAEYAEELKERQQEADQAAEEYNIEHGTAHYEYDENGNKIYVEDNGALSTEDYLKKENGSLYVTVVDGIYGSVGTYIDLKSATEGMKYVFTEHFIQGENIPEETKNTLRSIYIVYDGEKSLVFHKDANTTDKTKVKMTLSQLFENLFQAKPSEYTGSDDEGELVGYLVEEGILEDTGELVEFEESKFDKAMTNTNFQIDLQAGATGENISTETGLAAGDGFGLVIYNLFHDDSEVSSFEGAEGYLADSYVQSENYWLYMKNEATGNYDVYNLYLSCIYSDLEPDIMRVLVDGKVEGATLVEADDSIIEQYKLNANTVTDEVKEQAIAEIQTSDASHIFMASSIAKQDQITQDDLDKILKQKENLARAYIDKDGLLYIRPNEDGGNYNVYDRYLNCLYKDITPEEMAKMIMYSASGSEESPMLTELSDEEIEKYKTNSRNATDEEKQRALAEIDLSAVKLAEEEYKYKSGYYLAGETTEEDTKKLEFNPDKDITSLSYTDLGRNNLARGYVEVRDDGKIGRLFLRNEDDENYSVYTENYCLMWSDITPDGMLALIKGEVKNPPKLKEATDEIIQEYQDRAYDYDTDMFAAEDSAKEVAEAKKDSWDLYDVRNNNFINSDEVSDADFGQEEYARAYVRMVGDGDGGLTHDWLFLLNDETGNYDVYNQNFSCFRKGITPNAMRLILDDKSEIKVVEAGPDIIEEYQHRGEYIIDDEYLASEAYYDTQEFESQGLLNDLIDKGNQEASSEDLGDINLADAYVDSVKQWLYIKNSDTGNYDIYNLYYSCIYKDVKPSAMYTLVTNHSGDDATIVEADDDIIQTYKDRGKNQLNEIKNEAMLQSAENAKNDQELQAAMGNDVDDTSNDSFFSKLWNAIKTQASSNDTTSDLNSNIGSYGTGKYRISHKFGSGKNTTIEINNKNIIERPKDNISDIISKEIKNLSIQKDNDISTTNYTPKYGRGKSDGHDTMMNYGNIPYNAPGDTIKQTIGNSGCGVVAGVNAVNTINGNNSADVRNATKMAIDGGYKERDGGTKPGFFMKLFNKNGIDSNMHTSKKNIEESIRNSNPTVLMGINKNNNARRTPYGNESPHYVLATGADNDSVIIQDPQDARQDVRYKMKDVLNTTQFGISTSSRRYGSGKNSKIDSNISAKYSKLLKTRKGKFGRGNVINLPSGLGSAFTYMGWQCITSPSSTQYKLRKQAGQKFDDEGFGRINGHYTVAVTTTYGTVGDYIDVTQSDGTVFHCVIADIKNQSDAGCNKWGHSNGKVVLEFVVDKSSWYSPKHANPGTKSCHPEWGNKTIVKIENLGSYFSNPSRTVSKPVSGDGDTSTVSDGGSAISLSDLTIKEMLIPDKYLPGGSVDIKGITVHYVGNANTSAEANAKYFQNGATSSGKYVGAHYIVGLKGEYVRCVPDNVQCSHAGSLNSTTIGIENCHPDETGKFNDTTYKALVKLCAALCNEYNIDPSTCIYRHYDDNQKCCPKWWSPNGPNPDADSDFEKFKSDVAAKLASGSSSSESGTEAKGLSKITSEVSNIFTKLSEAILGTSGGSDSSESSEPSNKIEKYTKYAEKLANDDSHGYSQPNRWGGTDFDCSSFVISSVEHAGIPVKSKGGAGSTSNMLPTFKDTGFEDVTSDVDPATGEGMERGDILLAVGSHTGIFTGNGKMVHASIDENNGTTGATPGDQTGKEVTIADFYSHPWSNILRYTVDDNPDVETDDEDEDEDVVDTSEEEDTSEDTSSNTSKNNSNNTSSSKTKVYGPELATESNVTKNINSLLGKGKSKIPLYGMDKDYVGQTWSILKGLGYSDEATAGILGNMKQESGVNPTAIEANGKGPAAGIVQWMNYNTKSGRWKNMSDYAESKGKDWTDLESQVEYVDKELTGIDTTCVDTLDKKYGGVEGFKNMTDVDKATLAFEEAFERAGVPAMENRYSAAHEYYDKYKGTSGSSDSDDDDSSSDSSKPATGLLKITSEFSNLVGKLSEAIVGVESKPATTSSSSSSDDDSGDSDDSDSSVENGDGNGATGTNAADKWFTSLDGFSSEKSSGYGTRNGSWHNGIDYPAIAGSKVKTPIGGTVDTVMQNAKTGSGFGGYGNIVVVKDPYDMYHWFGHLQKTSVDEGDSIKSNTVIGLAGRTGKCSSSYPMDDAHPNAGVHVHYTISSDNRDGNGRQDIDPNSYNYSTGKTGSSSGKGKFANNEMSKIISGLGKLTAKQAAEIDLEAADEPGNGYDDKKKYEKESKERIKEYNKTHKIDKKAIGGGNEDQSINTDIIQVFVNLLQQIVNNTSKLDYLQTIIELLSEQFDIAVQNSELTAADVTKLNKIKKKLKQIQGKSATTNQGSSTGFGNSLMNSDMNYLMTVMSGIAGD